MLSRDGRGCAAAWPFRRVSSAPTVGRIEPPPSPKPTPRYVNIFNRVGRSYEVVPLDEDGAAEAVSPF